jgi:ABC-2 type transport system ATP-binding protein
MARRLEIARSLLHTPDVLFLDEPTIGLDPQTRALMWEDVLRMRRDEGVTVFLTTDYMDEAEYADRIAIIDHGRIVALDTPESLISAHAPGTTIEFDAPHGVDEAELASLPGVERVAVDGRVEVSTRTPELVLRELLDPHAAWLRRDDAGQATAIRDLRVRQGTLEDVFIALTGRSLRA